MKFGPLLLTLITGMGSCSPHSPAPGPVPLDSPSQMQGFLSSSNFYLVGDDTDWWAFDDMNGFRAHVEGLDLAGVWSATVDELQLSELGTAPDRVLLLRWLDGKLNIEIDGRQYRRRGSVR